MADSTLVILAGPNHVTSARLSYTIWHSVGSQRKNKYYVNKKNMIISRNAFKNQIIERLEHALFFRRIFTAKHRFFIRNSFMPLIRNFLDFWGRLETDKCTKNVHITIACTVYI